MVLDLAHLARTLDSTATVRVTGRLRAVVGLSLRADLPDARVGELVEIERTGAGPLLAEIVGFDAQGVTLLPLGEAHGLAPDDPITLRRTPLRFSFGPGLLGRVLDGLGQPIDGGPALHGEPRDVMRSAPPALTRKRIDQVLPLGVRALDAFTTVGQGQRIGLFSASGVGKSTLLGQIARHAQADVCVLCMVGERGRELNDFLQDHLGTAGMQRCVVVCATSDAPALVRMSCPYVATAIAEGFRDQGQRVVLLMDSLTRFARAARDVGLAAGEPPVRRGYPPSLFAALPGLLERAGTSDKGSITAFYTVLVEGDDLDEPISDELRGLLDGHIVLSRAVAARGRYPAIDVRHSLSRLMPRLVTPEHREAAERVRAHLSLYEDKRDLVMLGAYRAGGDARLDAALARIERIEALLRQREDERCEYADAVAQLCALA
jgi:type III secretion protein N (ATPase)